MTSRWARARHDAGRNRPGDSQQGKSMKMRPWRPEASDAVGMGIDPRRERRTMVFIEESESGTRKGNYVG
jgi:hypothetical protein